MLLRVALGFSLLAGFALPAVSQTENGNETLASLIKASRMEISVSQSGVEGPGAEWLVGQAKAAHFFMFGEQHATADIAYAAVGLAGLLGAEGYQHAAIEVGPWSTPIAERLLRGHEGADFVEFLSSEGRLLTFPFLFYAEEIDFTLRVIAQGAEAPVLWGVDQEFIAAGGILLSELMLLAETEEQRQAIAEAQAAAAANLMFLGTVGPETFDNMAKAFSGGSAVALRMIAEMRLSNEIYAPFMGRGGSVWQANQAREIYMKRNFVTQFEAATEKLGRTPKVFLKFGANHLAWGHSPTNVLSLGNFVHEYGLAKGLASFNLHLDCIGGQGLDPRSGTAVDCTSYFLSVDSPLRDFIFPDRPTLINLKALRRQSRLWKDWDRKTKNLIWAYDAYLAIPDVKAARLAGH
jgi:hypothetical protein